MLVGRGRGARVVAFVVLCVGFVVVMPGVSIVVGVLLVPRMCVTFVVCVLVASASCACAPCPDVSATSSAGSSFMPHFGHLSGLSLTTLQVHRTDVAGRCGVHGQELHPALRTAAGLVADHVRVQSDRRRRPAPRGTHVHLRDQRERLGGSASKYAESLPLGHPLGVVAQDVELPRRNEGTAASPLTSIVASE